MNTKLKNNWLKRWKESGLKLDSFFDGWTPEGFEEYIDYQIYWMNPKPYDKFTE